MLIKQILPRLIFLNALRYAPCALLCPSQRKSAVKLLESDSSPVFRLQRLKNLLSGDGQGLNPHPHSGFHGIGHGRCGRNIGRFPDAHAIVGTAANLGL